MTELAYIPRHFRKCVKYQNLIKFEEFKNQELIHQACLAAYDKISKKNEWIDAIKTIKIKGNTAYTINNPESVLVNNLIVSNVGAKYKIKCIDRDFTIRLLMSHIKDSYAYTVHRLDVRSFYESFDRRNIIVKLKSEAKLSRKTISILENLFQELTKLGAKGLPRGMGISSALSELMMNPFDEYMRATKDILFYSRFVDDIIILTTPKITKSKLGDIIESSPFPKELKLHESGDKVAFKPIKKTSSDSLSESNFDYLGYEFKIKNNENDTGDNLNIKRRVLEVEISNEKIKKLKSRIIKSFSNFLTSKDAPDVKLDLLRKRLNFLSKNYPLVNSQDKKQIMSGIYYNYKHASKVDKLKEIDCFYRSILFGQKSNLSKRIRKWITYKDRCLLSQISFVEGFTDIKFCKFSYKDFKEIKRAWV